MVDKAVYKTCCFFVGEFRKAPYIRINKNDVLGRLGSSEIESGLIFGEKLKIKGESSRNREMGRYRKVFLTERGRVKEVLHSAGKSRKGKESNKLKSKRSRRRLEACEGG